MSEKVEGRNGDVALFLYAAPFIINFVYALYVWAGVGFSSVLPQLVYIEVSQNNYIFLLGFAAVVCAALLDFTSEPAASRRSSTFSLSKRLQALAMVALVLSFLAAWYSASGNLSTAVYNVMDGRYALVFPAVILLFSYIILPPVKLQGANLRNILVIVLLFLSPAALYELGKRNTAAGLGSALILILLAAYILLRDSD